MRIDRAKLIEAMAVLDLVPQRAGIPSSDYVLMEWGKKSLEFSLASEVAGFVSVPILEGTLPQEPSFSLDRRMWMPFVSAGKDQKKVDFSLESRETSLLLQQGRRKGSFDKRRLGVTGYGKKRDLSKLRELKISTELRKLLLASVWCSTGDPALPHLNCVYVRKGRVYATNTVVTFRGVAAEEDALNIPFPAAVVPLLKNKEVQQVGIDGNQVVLDCGCGYLEGSVSQAAMDGFPIKKLREQIEQGMKWPKMMELNSKELKRAIDRMAIYLGGIRRQDWLLQLRIQKDRARLLVKVVQGQFEEVISATGRDGAQAEWPLEMMLEALQYMADQSDQVVVRGDDTRGTPYLLETDVVRLMVARKEE